MFYSLENMGWRKIVSDIPYHLLNTCWFEIWCMLRITQMQNLQVFDSYFLCYLLGLHYWDVMKVLCAKHCEESSLIRVLWMCHWCFNYFVHNYQHYISIKVFVVDRNYPSRKSIKLRLSVTEVHGYTHNPFADASFKLVTTLSRTEKTRSIIT